MEQITDIHAYINTGLLALLGIVLPYLIATYNRGLRDHIAASDDHFTALEASLKERFMMVDGRIERLERLVGEDVTEIKAIVKDLKTEKTGSHETMERRWNEADARQEVRWNAWRDEVTRRLERLEGLRLASGGA